MIQAALCAVLSLSAGAVAPSAMAADTTATAGTGVIVGNITNKVTGNGLIGAKVEIPALKREAFVDNTGRYILNGIPAGSQTLVVSYTGMDTQTVTVNVTAGQPAVRDFEMSSGVLVLDAFKVASVKEGAASALTQQRNADNLKSVASMDALNDLPNMNATELAIRLPGVTFGDPGDEVVESVSVRGMGLGTTSIQIDGGGMSSFSASNRNTRMTAFTGAMFEALELTKGQTPDRWVDSLGGSINFKTRSPLSMREKRRVSFTATARTAPYFTEQVPLREQRRTHELINVSYMEKFSIFGSQTENLAVSVNGFYSENAFGFYRTQRDYQQTLSSPAYVWDYRTVDNYNNRMQRSLNTKWDFRLDRNNLFKLNLVVNDAPEPMRRQYNFRAFAGSQTTVPSATTGVVPGQFTDRITVVRAVPVTPTGNNTSGTTQPALIDQSTSNINRNQRLRHGDLAGEHTWGPFNVDWAGLWSRTRYRYLGNESSLTNRLGNIPLIGPNGRNNSAAISTTNPGPIDNVVGPNGETGVGWILDRTQSDLYPRFIQNGGLDFTNPNNYRPSVNGLSTSSGSLDVDLIRELRGNVQYKVPVEFMSLNVKGGYALRDHNVEQYRPQRRWSYIGRNALPNDPTILTWSKIKTGLNVPYWDTNQFYYDGKLKDPNLWQEDMYYATQNKLQNTWRIHEEITAYYGMFQGKIGNRFGFLGGVRHEKSFQETFVNLRTTGTLSNAAQQAADPTGSALADYNHPTHLKGNSADNFPSLHLWYNITPNLKARASWSTGMARPALNNTVAALTFNTTTETITVGNPSQRPEKAQNWDFGLDYVYEPSGHIYLGWFRKRIDDYWTTNMPVGVVGAGQDNGFGGEFAGYQIVSNGNSGTVYTQGFEFEFQQTFRFLPGLLKTLGFNANFTKLTSHGLFYASGFGSAQMYLKDKDVYGMTPLVANLGFNWAYKKFSVSASYNYTAEQIRASYSIPTTASPTNPARNRYLKYRELVNLNMYYQLPWRGMSLGIGVQNLFNAPQRYYRGIPSQMETFLINGTTMTATLQGRF